MYFGKDLQSTRCSLKNFKEWRRKWADYTTMVNLPSLSLSKQLIQLPMRLSLEQNATSACALPKLQLNQHVHVQNPVSLRWNNVSTIMDYIRYHKHMVKLPSGPVRWRNRDLLHLAYSTNHRAKETDMPCFPTAYTQPIQQPLDAQSRSVCSNSSSPPKTHL